MENSYSIGFCFGIYGGYLELGYRNISNEQIIKLSYKDDY